MQSLFTVSSTQPAATFQYTSPQTGKVKTFQVPPLNATQLVSTPDETGVADQAALAVIPTNAALCNRQPSAIAPPRSYDFREEFWEYTSPIVDQGSCGACWSIASIQAFASRYAFATNQQVPSLSVAYLLYCLRATTFSRFAARTYGCYGGSLINAYWFLIRDGTVSTECVQYDAIAKWDPTSSDLERREVPLGDVKSNVFCPMLVCPAKPGEQPKQPWVYKCAMAYILAGTEKQGGSEANIRRDIWLKGPASTGFQVRQDFVEYWKGLLEGTLQGDARVYRPQPPDETRNPVIGNHAVQLVGWGTTEGGVDFWIVANSWGASNTSSSPAALADYGNNGYFLMVRGVNAAAIESNVVAGIPLVHPHMVNAVGRPGYTQDVEMCDLVAFEVNLDMFAKLSLEAPKPLPDYHSLYEFTLPPLYAERAAKIRRFAHCPADRDYRCPLKGTCVTSPLECGTVVPSHGLPQPVQLLTTAPSKAVSREVVKKYFSQTRLAVSVSRTPQSLTWVIYSLGSAALVGAIVTCVLLTVATKK